ncbi:MAG: NACHT domain-containing protein [Dermatophilaceae bacterium]
MNGYCPRSPPKDSILHELVAVHFCGADAARREIVYDNFCTLFRQALQDTSAKASDTIAAAVYKRTEEAIERVISELRKADGEAFLQMQSLAASSLLDATLQALGRHRTALNRYNSPEHMRALESWLMDYRHQVAAAHGFIAPPDFERKRKVPMDALYVAPRIRPGSFGAESRIQVGIHEFASRIDRTVLLGDPGGGKSTAASFIAFTSSKDINARVPFFVVLRDFARDEDLDRSISTYVEERCAALYQCKPPEGAIEHLLLSGEALVIFDGLDELIDTSLRREVTQRVELFSERYPLCSALVTSRRVGYDQAQLDPRMFDTFVLGGFDADDVSEYVKKWFSSVEELEGADLELAHANFLSESETVPDLTSTPLMLALMCIIYRGQGYIPKNRPAVYEHCALLLFEKWDSSRKIYVDLRAADKVDSAVKHLAYWMLTERSGAEAVTEGELVSEAASFLANTFEDENERRRAAAEFVEFCRGRAWVLSDAGTTADGEALFKFTHRTFMEYFAAYELTRRSDGPSDIARVLLPHVAAQEWDVVGQLAIQIFNKHSKDGAERVFDLLLGDQRRRSETKRDNIYRFIWRCLPFIHVSPTLLRRLVTASLEASFHRRGDSRNETFGESRPSILHSVDVFAEGRHVVAETLLAGFAAMIESEDPERVAYAKIAVLSWNAVPFIGESKTADREWWTNWAQTAVTGLSDRILADGPGDRDAWLLALLRGHVDMYSFLDKMAPGEALLDPLFASQSGRPLGFSYSSWGSQMLRTRMFHKPPSSEKEAKALEPRIEQLRQLGTRLPAPIDHPWLEGPTRPFPSSRIDREDWTPFSHDEDVNWAMWALYACRVEMFERSLRGSREFTPEDLGLTGRVLEARGSGATAPEDLFLGTMFGAFDGPRREMRDAWAGGTLSVTRLGRPRVR